MNFPRIGMRNIKTSMSVFICLLLFEIFNRDNSIQACIAAVICLQNTVVDSFQKGVARILGTAIGGIVGAFVLFIVNTFVGEHLLIFIIPLGIVLLIEICVAIDMKQSVVICCVVYLGILISKEHEGGYVLYTINRVFDTSVGIIITILVNKYMIMPNKLKKFLGISIETEADNEKINEIIKENKIRESEFTKQEMKDESNDKIN